MSVKKYPVVRVKIKKIKKKYTNTKIRINIYFTNLEENVFKREKLKHNEIIEYLKLKISHINC